MDASHRLREAVVNGNLGITKRLLARFPELWLNTDPAHSGWCNLHYASYHGNYLVCFHLVSMMSRRHVAHSDLDLVTFDHLTVLHLPVFKHQSQTLHLLLQEFSSSRWIDFRGGSLRRTPLHYCCVHDFVDGFKLLLEFGADWSVQDANGDTCLHLCFAYNSVACMEQLVRFVVVKAAASPSAPADFDLASSDLASSSTVDLGSAPVPALVPLESALNNREYPPVLLAATFELQNNYPAMRAAWVQSALAEVRLVNSSQLYFPSPHTTSLDVMASPLTTLQNNSRVSETSGSAGSDRADTLADEPSSPTSKASTKMAQASTPLDPERAPGGRKHSASLPPAHSADADRPTFLRRHSKSLVQGFGAKPTLSSSPVQVRPPSTPLIAFSNSKSPLQVEFTRTLSRKSLGTPQGRSEKEFFTPTSKYSSSKETLSSSKDTLNSSKDKEVSDETISMTSRNHSLPLVSTPGSAKSVHQFYFSPLSSGRQRSVSGSSSSVDRHEGRGSDPQGMDYPRNTDHVSRTSSGNSTPVARVPLSRTSSAKFQANGSLRRNSSTPSVVYSNSSTENMIKRPQLKSSSDLQRKLTISSSTLTEDDGSDLEIAQAADKSMESLSEEKVLSFMISRRTPSKSKFDERKDQMRSANVSSISFTRVRDE